MSLARVFSHTIHGLRLVAGAAGQLLVAAAATAGVLVIAGCGMLSREHARGGQQGQAISAQAAMPSPIAAPPQGILVEPPRPAAARPAPARPAQDGAASAAERQASRKSEIEALLREAGQLPPLSAPVPRGSSALRVADRAITPLATTLASIESAQRVVVDNLRNIEVPGFKASRSACSDGRDIARQLDVSQGDVQPTQRPLDIAIQGEGFLPIQVYMESRPEGVVGYTRNGRLFVAKDGNLVVGQPDGYQLVPKLQVPVGTTELKIDADGSIRATQAGVEKSGQQPVGRITLARFTDPTALQPLGGGIYAETEASGMAVESAAGERGAGTLVQGSLEGSNVDLLRERLRLRFLQNWRAAILAAIDGEGSGPAEPQPEPAEAPARRQPSIQRPTPAPVNK